jgi:hypothetical protein
VIERSEWNDFKTEVAGCRSRFRDAGGRKMGGGPAFSTPLPEVPDEAERRRASKDGGKHLAAANRISNRVPGPCLRSQMKTVNAL